MSRRHPMNILLMAGLILIPALLLVPIMGTNALAGVIVEQRFPGGGLSHPCNDWIGNEVASEWIFDDFSTDVPWLVGQLTIYGNEASGSCDDTCNEYVRAEIWTGLPGAFGGEMLLQTISGHENGDGSLTLDFGDQLLPPGDYWMRAWVRRDMDDWWRWYMTPHRFGSEAYWWNPGGGWGGGPDPIPFSEAWNMGPMDMTFMLEGTPAVGEICCVGPVPGRANEENTWYVSGATPGEVVYFIYGLAAGSTNVPGCSGVTVDMQSPKIFGSPVADANGEVNYVKFIPPAASGRRVYFQAVDHSTCRVTCLTEFVFP